MEQIEMVSAEIKCQLNVSVLYLNSTLYIA